MNTILKIKLETIEFSVWKIGSGSKTAFFLHGFPDSPSSWFEVATKFAEADFTCYIPYLRGYHPTKSLGNPETHSPLEMADELNQLVRSITPKKNISLFGHDWGSVLAYFMAIRSPELFSELGLLSVPPISVFLKNLLFQPEQLVRSWYMLFFQLEKFPEEQIQHNDLISKLWMDWSPGWKLPKDRLQDAIDCLTLGDGSKEAVSYYRSLLPGFRNFAKWSKARAVGFQKVSIPTKLLVGELDNCIPPKMFAGSEYQFLSQFSFHVIPGAGHFLPLEAPNKIYEILK